MEDNILHLALSLNCSIALVGNYTNLHEMLWDKDLPILLWDINSKLTEYQTFNNLEIATIIHIDKYDIHANIEVTNCLIWVVGRTEDLKRQSALLNMATNKMIFALGNLTENYHQEHSR